MKESFNLYVFILLLLLLLLLMFVKVNAQALHEEGAEIENFHNNYLNITPPSPKAFEFTEYGNLPVNLSTGKLSLSIPLFELTHKGHSVPVSLKYISNGVKVDQMPTSVGLGWNLNLGGAVTRVVRDLPDNDYTYNNLRSFGEITWQVVMNNREFFNAAQINPFLDTAPDIYNYSAMGISGSFVLTKENSAYKVIPLEESLNKIEFNGLVFYVTDPEGTRYTFSSTESTLRGRMLPFRGGECRDYSEPVNAVTSWYLTQINYLDGTVFTFNYEEESYQYTSGLFESVSYFTGKCLSNQPESCNNIENKVTRCVSNVSIQGKRLVSVTSNNGDSIDLSYLRESNEVDSGTFKFLESIKLRSQSTDEEIKETVFEYNNGQANKRVFLVSIETNGEEKHSFTYDGISQLPTRLSFAKDHWGYYNGQDEATSLIDESYIGGVNVPSCLEIDFSDRSPNENFGSLGLLSQVTYPTGGSTRIRYEENEIKIDEETKIVGGYRVKSIKDKAGPSQPSKTRDYRYNEDFSISQAPFLFRNESYTLSRGLAVPYEECKIATVQSNPLFSIFNGFDGDGINYKEVDVIYRDNQTPSYNPMDSCRYTLFGRVNTNKYTVFLGDDFSTFVNDSDGLKRVCSIDNGATYFYCKENGDSLPPNYCRKLVGKPSFERHRFYTSPRNIGYPIWNGDAYDVSGIPVSSHMLDNFPHEYNGKPKSIEYYKKIEELNFVNVPDNDVINATRDSLLNVAHKIKKTTYSYSLGYGQGLENNIYGFSTKQNYNFVGTENNLLDNISIYVSNQRKYRTRLDSLKETTYFTKHDSLVTSKKYLYQTSSEILPSKIITDVSSYGNGSKVKDIYYPQDLLNQGIQTYEMQRLMNENRIGKTVKTETFKEGTKILSSIIKYQRFINDGTDLLLPSEVHSLKGEENGNVDLFYSSSRKVKYDRYDGKGNLLQYTLEDGTPVSFIWGYDNQHIIAKIEGATYVQIQGYVDNLQLLSDLDVNSESELNLYNALNTLRAQNIDYLITTYTYDPLVGVKSITSPNGQTTYYKYDGFGRLETVKDEAEHKLQDIEYNYRLQ